MQLELKLAMYHKNKNLTDILKWHRENPLVHLIVILFWLIMPLFLLDIFKSQNVPYYVQTAL